MVNKTATIAFGDRYFQGNIIGTPTIPVSVRVADLSTEYISFASATSNVFEGLTTESHEEGSYMTQAINQTELDFFMENFNRIIEQYNGKWLAISKNEIVAEGTDFGETLSIAIGRGVISPLIILADKESWEHKRL
ncbi:MAG: hypothetical protein NC238_17990 [Dehalobacter sp.]|nr:hypothetical protein [Dehalobacter sp.]